jgi:cation diffusion facilitator family transporter
MNKQSAAFFSVISNTTLVVLKVIAGIMMGSVSVLSEAIHSGIDLVASMVAFVSIRESNKPADHDHPYGHGKFENISGFFEAILIFLAAGIIIFEAIKKLIAPPEVEQVDWGIAVMFISVIVNIFVSRLLFKIAKKEDSIALEADAMHLSVDIFTSVGVLAGLVVIKITGLKILDPIIALCVATLILRASWDLTRKSLQDLADKSLPPEELELIKSTLKKYPAVKDFHRLRTRKSGKQKEIDFHLLVDASLSISDAHLLCDKIEHDLKSNLVHTYVVIHVEPYSLKSVTTDTKTTGLVSN